MLNPGASSANIFGPAFLREYRQYYQEQQRAKKDTTKLEAVESRDRDLPLPAEYVIQGIIDDPKLNQAFTGYISLKNAQTLAGTGKAVDGLNVTLTDSFRAGEVKADLAKTLPANWEIPATGKCPVTSLTRSALYKLVRSCPGRPALVASIKHGRRLRVDGPSYCDHVSGHSQQP